MQKGVRESLILVETVTIHCFPQFLPFLSFHASSLCKLVKACRIRSIKVQVNFHPFYRRLVLQLQGQLPPYLPQFNVAFHLQPNTLGQGHHALQTRSVRTGSVKTHPSIQGLIIEQGHHLVKAYSSALGARESDAGHTGFLWVNH